MDKTLFIVNPHSANGSTGREWPGMEARAKQVLGGPFSVSLTSRPGEAAEIARAAALGGAERIICVGGDGTLNEVVNGLMGHDRPVRDDILVGFFPNGNGCDFTRSVRLPSDLDCSLQVLQRSQTRTIDLGRLECLDNSGNTIRRYFHNVASFGLGGEVANRVNRSGKMFGPFVSFLWATIAAVLLHGKKKIRLRVDGVERQYVAWNIAVANGQFHGSGMWIAPQASVSDGLLNVTVLGDLNLAAVCWNLPRLYNGTIGKNSKVEFTSGKSVSAESDQTVLIEMDGEQPGTLPARIEVMPSALRIIVE